MIKHQVKHQILKHLADAGSIVAFSDLPAEKKRSYYGRLQKLMEDIKYLDEEDQCSCQVERETEEVMELSEALECLSSGHALWVPKEAYQICKAIGVAYDKTLEQHWYSDWSDPKGMHMSEGCEGSIGVWSLILSEYVAEQLGVKERAGSYIGRGFQAQAYAKEIKKYLEERR